MSGIVTYNSMWVHKSHRDSSGFAKLARPLASRHFAARTKVPVHHAGVPTRRGLPIPT